MNKITFYIARHGKTLMNTLDKVQGWCDSPLTQEGIESAQYLGLGLKDIHFDAVYCSDLRRTRQTAQIILDVKNQSDISIIEKPEFREACFGSFESDYNSSMWGNAAKKLGYKSLEAMYSDLVDKKIGYPQVLDMIKSMDTLGMAENFKQLETRTQKGLKEIAETEQQKGSSDVLVIAHGVSILGMLLNLGGDKLLKGALINAAVCKVTYQNAKFTVESMGDTSYIENGKRLNV